MRRASNRCASTTRGRRGDVELAVDQHARDPAPERRSARDAATRIFGSTMRPSSTTTLPSREIGAAAHRHVVVAARRALAAALRVRAGGEQEVAGEAARRGAAALGRVAVEGERVPAALRIRGPSRRARRRRGRGRPSPVLPSASQSRISAASTPPSMRDDVAFADLEPDRIDDVAAIGKDDDVAGLEHDLAVRAAFVREGVQQADAPVVEAAGLVGHAVLAHHRVLAAAVREVGAGAAGDANLLRLLVERLGVQDRLLQPGRRLQLVAGRRARR